MNRGFEMLCDAITQQACADYLKALKDIEYWSDVDVAIERIMGWSYINADRIKAERIRQSKLASAKALKAECEWYFRGEWQKDLTGLDADALIEQLNKMHEDEKMQKNIKKYKKVQNIV